MSILEDLLAALLRNNELLEESNKGREAAIAAAQAASNKPASGGKAKDKEKTDAPPTDAGAATTGTPTIEDVNAAIVAYATGTDRAEERDARKAKILTIIKKTNKDGKNGADVPEGKRVSFINALKTLLEQGDLTEAPATEDEGDAGSDDLLG